MSYTHDKTTVAFSRSQAMKLASIERKLCEKGRAQTLRSLVELVFDLEAAGVIDLSTIKYESLLTLQEKRKECTEKDLGRQVEEWLFPPSMET